MKQRKEAGGSGQKKARSPPSGAKQTATTKTSPSTNNVAKSGLHTAVRAHDAGSSKAAATTTASSKPVNADDSGSHANSSGSPLEDEPLVEVSDEGQEQEKEENMQKTNKGKAKKGDSHSKIATPAGAAGASKDHSSSNAVDDSRGDHLPSCACFETVGLSGRCREKSQWSCAVCCPKGPFTMTFAEADACERSHKQIPTARIIAENHVRLLKSGQVRWDKLQAWEQNGVRKHIRETTFLGREISDSEFSSRFQCCRQWWELVAQHRKVACVLMWCLVENTHVPLLCVVCVSLSICLSLVLYASVAWRVLQDEEAAALADASGPSSDDAARQDSSSRAAGQSLSNDTLSSGDGARKVPATMAGAGASSKTKSAVETSTPKVVFGSVVGRWAVQVPKGDDVGPSDDDEWCDLNDTAGEEADVSNLSAASADGAGAGAGEV